MNLKPLAKKYYKTFSLFGLCLLVYFASNNSFGADYLYGNFFFPTLSQILRSVSRLFTFALGDLIYLLLLVLTLVYLVKKIFTLKRQKQLIVSMLLLFLRVFMGSYLVFMLFWGINYKRTPINKRLSITNHPYTATELINLGQLFLNHLTSLDKQIKQQNLNFSKDKSVLFAQSIAAYQALNKEFTFLQYHKPTIKEPLSNWLSSKMGIEGYYNILSGEANVNLDLPSFVLPFVSCHEVAHQLGIAKEDEANLIGYLSASKSSNLLFQFSAYYNMFRNILLEIRLKYPSKYAEFRDQIPSFIVKMFEEEQKYWAQYNGELSRYMSISFDRILKMNNQEKGIASYQDIVLWLYNYHKHELGISPK